MSRCSCLIYLAAVALACRGAAAQDAREESTPPARLKPSPTLEPPPLRPPQQAVRLSTDREAIFLRADRLDRG